MNRETKTPAVEVLLIVLVTTARIVRPVFRALWTPRAKRLYIRGFALALYACASAPPPSPREPITVESPSDAAYASHHGVTAKLEPLPGMQKHGFDPRQYYERRALYALSGVASYYGDQFAGRSTANGERYDPDAYTAAHRSLPFGTIVRVTRRSTGDWVLVRINDRGPFGKRQRILDLSKQAARRLGMLHDGIAKVRAEVLEEGRRRKR